uniref:NADH-ubiquinone oxidoreductase chain 4 n=1 Tax=Scutopus ventrolineatus TaxID=52922 RepID=A0A096XEB5_SCUVE|nr:NADH dehydrogenase subunit 4 [Scutopus ventrolineatus]AHI45698.1 NADH dehydrogenase subunit 4 [Scutopus ventrolineatus]
MGIGVMLGSMLISLFNKKHSLIRLFFLFVLLLSCFIFMWFLYCPGLSVTCHIMELFGDGLSIPLIIMTCWISSLMILCSNKLGLSFYYVVLLLNLMLVVFFLASSLFGFYIFFEAVLVPTLLLILKWGNQPERLQAGLYMMIYTIVASLPLFLGIIFFNYCGVTSLSMNSFEMNYSMSDMEMNFLWFMVVLAFLVKLPMFPFHLWLPKAHVEAPVAGSMVLAAILLKLGGHGLLRFSFLLPKMVGMSNILFILGGLGGSVTSLICLRQTDMKCLIAYSSVGHMGLMLSAAMSKTFSGVGACLGIMIAHGLCSSGLFSLSNYAYSSTSTRSLYLYKGALSVFPMMSMWWFLLCACNMAAPPTLNLLSEIFLFVVIMSFFWGGAVLVGLLSFLAACYNLYLYTVTQHGKLPLFQNSLLLADKMGVHLTAFMHWFPLLFLLVNATVVFVW